MARKLIDTSTARPVMHIDAGTTRRSDDDLVIEQPLEIRLGSTPVSVTMRTPGHDEELAAGFCLTEGIVRHADDIDRITRCNVAQNKENIIMVLLEHEDEAKVARAGRATFMSSSCGICGKESIDRIHQTIEPIVGDFTVTPDLLHDLPRRMRAAQRTFDTTGGLHAAALFTPAGELIVLREDVGRHNAVDKAIGYALLDDRLPLDRCILLVSGRSSFEIMQKAAMAGVAMVCAVSAPSSLAVDFAERVGQTLIGFLRDQRMNVYTHAERVR